MTPKFDNLASLLMEMGSPHIPDEKRLEIAEYIEEFPEATFPDIAAAFGVGFSTVGRIAKELGISRGAEKGSEKHIRRKLTDAQEKEMLDYWLANHHEMTYVDLVRWLKQQFNVSVEHLPSHIGFGPLLDRVAAKHGVKLPERPLGRPPMKRIADRRKKQHATDPTGLKTTKPSFTGPHSASTTTSNTRHNPRHSPTPPMDQDKRL
jgi:hypothetical protein